MALLTGIAVGGGASALMGQASQSAPIDAFGFDDDGANSALVAAHRSTVADGLVDRRLMLAPGDSAAVELDDSSVFGPSNDFSVAFWVRTTAGSDRRMTLLSTKRSADNSLASQKQAGWTYYVSDGTWAWNLGSGDRRLTYERDNGLRMPLNDGRWHQLAMTYDADRAQLRLYYDGRERALYNVADAPGFDFSSSSPLVAGWRGEASLPSNSVLPAIEQGRESLQQMVDEFNSYGLPALTSDEFVHLLVDPEDLFASKVSAAAEDRADPAGFAASMEPVDLERLAQIESALMDNPYTIHQALTFMETAPAMKVFSLVDSEVTIDSGAARWFADRERLDSSDFDLDELEIWDRPLASEEIRSRFERHFESLPEPLAESDRTVTAGVWNIFHGGRHFTLEEHGWDSRHAIAQILERENIDVVMMQETYSSGDFIAAELGYYYATTVDRDYLNQGSNISVMSRYPIADLFVEGDSTFMNVGAKLTLSESQDIYVMSNWYGMAQFPTVFEFHDGRFAESNRTPTLFGGDFNAVPHTDGGDSPASLTLAAAGFIDAFRETHEDPLADPGHTHRSGVRIDQLFYKGAGLRNAQTRLINTGLRASHRITT